MAETFVVTWGEEQLELRRIPSEGLWAADLLPLRAVPAQRPTRLARLDHPDAGGQLASTLHNLLLDVDLTIPYWFLLPRGWAYTTTIDLPELPTPQERLEHLRWEIIARLANHIEEFRIIHSTLDAAGAVKIIAVTGEVIDYVYNFAKKADLELAGIGVEPKPGETYSFEHPTDLRDAAPLVVEPAPEKGVPTKITVSPVAAAAVLIVVLGAAAYLLLSPFEAEQPPLPAAPAVIPPAPKPETAPTPVPAVPSPSPAVSDVQPSTPAAAVSPLRQIIDALPKDIQTRLAVLSPTDLRLEALGALSEDWLTQAKKIPALSKMTIVGRYHTSEGNITVLRILETGWLSGGKRDAQAWENSAKAAGMNARGRIAEGSLDKALALVDALYKTPAGISKIYLASASGKWTVTVQ